MSKAETGSSHRIEFSCVDSAQNIQKLSMSGAKLGRT